MLVAALWVSGKGLFPHWKNGPSVSNKKEKTTERFYLESVWKELSRAGQTLNYHDKQVSMFVSKPGQGD